MIYMYELFLLEIGKTNCNTKYYAFLQAGCGQIITNPRKWRQHKLCYGLIAWYNGVL